MSEMQKWFKSWGGPGSGNRGHKGIPGQKGGSMPGGPVANGNAYEPGTQEEYEEVAISHILGDYRPESIENESLRADVKKGLEQRLAERLVKDPKVWNDYLGYRQEITKNAGPGRIRQFTEAEQLSQEAAVKVGVREIVDTWAGTSGDTDPEALAFQRAVKDEFGVDARMPVGYEKNSPSYVHGRNVLSRDETDEVYKATGPFMRRVARAMYEETQEQLAKAGIKEVSVHRGVNFGQRGDKSPEWFEQLKRGSAVTRPISEKVLSSWSSSSGVASKFAVIGGRGQACLIGATIPARQVFCTARTGMGCLNEYEFVLFGGNGSAKFSKMDV